MKVHIVMGHTGEYEDHKAWPVAAYFDGRKARGHARRAERRAEELRPENRYGKPLGVNEHDPKMMMDYTGTTYGVMHVEVADEVKA
jgi:hypothetical protein